MGFSPPKPDPALVAQENATAAQAKQQKISLLQSQLNNEDQLRQRLYGSRNSLFGAPVQGSVQGANMAPLFSAIFGIPAQ